MEENLHTFIESVRSRRRIRGIVVAGLLFCLCAPALTSCEASYQDDLRKFCQAPELSGTSGRYAYMQRQLAIFAWIEKNIEHPEAVKLLSAMLAVSHELRRDLLLGEAQKHKVTPCALADWFVRPELPPGIRLPKSRVEFAHQPQFVQVSISPDAILVNDTRVAEVKKGALSSEQLQLLDKEIAKGAKDEKTLARANPARQFKGIFSLLADEQTPCGLAAQVMQTAARSGYQHSMLAVFRENGMLGQMSIALMKPKDLSGPTLERMPLNLTVAIRRDGFVVAGAGGVLGATNTVNGLKDPIGPTVPLATSQPSCKNAQSDRRPPPSDCYDYAGLTGQMKKIKEQFVRETQIILLAGRDTPYEVLTRTMDATRQHEGRSLFYNVLLGTPETAVITRDGVRKPTDKAASKKQ